MNNLRKIIPFILSGILTSAAIVITPEEFSYWVVILLPGFTFGTALFVALSGEKSFNQAKGLWAILLSMTVYALFFGITFYSVGLYHGALISAGGGLIMALIAIRMVLSKQLGNVLPYLLAGFVSWIGIVPVFFVKKSGNLNLNFFSTMALIFLLWHILVGASILYRLAKIKQLEENSHPDTRN